MKQIITIIIILGVLYFAREFNDYWKEVKRKNGVEEKGAPAAPAATDLPGMPENFEASWQSAKARGVVGMKQWLDLNRRFVRDPRLAAIQLDYVVLVASGNRVEARTVLEDVGRRIQPGSPVFERYKKLQQTYGQ
ncbi:MAG TPA: hypothetical protein VHH73_18850 [Verrucomicrobiae bacterium]|nr:hypothetical protein [Verrucomicrobiae bacterium]